VDPRELHNRLPEQPARGERMRSDLRQMIADAPPPPPPDEAITQLQPSEIAALASLGYVATGAGPAAATERELDRFEPVGGNPRDFARSFKAVSWELPQLLHRREFAQAEALLRPLINQMPQAANLHAHLGSVVEEQGRVDEAAAEFRRAVELAPADYQMRMKLGLFLRRVQRSEEALAQFAIANERWPDDVEALKQGALVLITLARLDEAEPKLQRALELQPRSAAVLRVMGLLREAQGRLPDALTYLNRALAIQPEFPECRQELERVLKALGA
jgi:tetratricopeptide (TPR) repeat protein